jgi:hypothetical protein
MICFLNIVFYLYFYTFWNILNETVRLINLAISCVAEIAYILTFLWNPGLPSQAMNVSYFEANKEKIALKNYRICKVCQVVMNMDEYTEHCDDCGVCIEGKNKYNTLGFDHHCPWTSKCVGRGNVVLFYIFLCFTLVLFVFLLFGIATLTH